MASKFSRLGCTAPAARRRAARSFRPHIESLEDRTTPALFTPQTPVNVTGLTNANLGCLATGDFNGDGKTDMVLTNYGTAAPGNNAAGKTISILLGNGTGGFGSASNITVGSSAYVSYVAVGDLNGDTKQDLAVVSSLEDSTGRLNIYLGNGSGGFTASAQGAIPTGSSNACWVGIAQVTNGDSNPDVVVCGFGDSDQGQSTIFGNNIGIFQGDGTGAVNLINTVANGLSFIPTALALADFDGDGKMDIAATVPGVPPDVSEPQPEGIIQMFSGNGAGGFDIGPSFGSGGALPINIQAADLNADNLPDLVIANAGDPDSANFYANFGSNNSVGVATNSGGLNFNTSSLTAGIGGTGGSRSVFAVTVADFDMDGKKDIGAILYGNPATFAHSKILAYKGDGTGGFVGDANSPFDTGTTDGQYLVAAPLDANGTPDIVYCNAVGKYGVLINNTVTGVAVTINQAAGQLDPTNQSPVSFAVHFNEAVTGFDATDISFAGSTVGGTLVANVSGSGADYTVTVTGMTGRGLVKASIPAGAANSVASGAPTLASTSTDNTVTFDDQAPTVTINQAAGQADPTTNSPIQFTVVFSEAVTGFDASDVDLTASSLGGLSAAVSGSGATYTVSVTGMSGNGTVIASIPAGKATDAAGNPNVASTSTDNTVTFGSPAPTVTINQAAGQADPTTNSPITFTVQFSAAVTGFDGGDVSFAGSTVGGTLSAAVSGSGADYTVTVTGMAGTGTVVASIPAGAANAASGGTASLASTSSDNSVTFDGVRPSVTINQAAGQADPTGTPSATFDVHFSEAVTGFTAADVSLAGSTAGGTLTTAVSGSGADYTVTVTGITGAGTVVASIPAGAAVDAAGNPNTASTSSDNSVSYAPATTIGFTQAVYDGGESGNGSDTTVTVTVTRTGQFNGAVSIDYATADVLLGAHSSGSALKGLNDYVPASGTLTWADGEGGDRTFTVTIKDDNLNEGKELVNLALSNLVSSVGVGLGITSSAVAIAPSDGKVITANSRTPSAKFTDIDGDVATVRLGGKLGTATVFVTDPDGDTRGPIELIQLAGTQPDPLKPVSTLTVGVLKAKTSFDVGTIGLGAITGTGVRAINARRANLIGDGISLNGYLGSLVIGNIQNGADVTTLATTNPLQKTRINALAIGNGTSIDVGATLAGLTAWSFGDGSLTAPSVGVINMTRGGFGADVNISGVGVDPLKKALGTLRVKGAVTGSDILVNGNVGTVAVGSFHDSRLFAGYTGPDDGSGNFNLPATVTSFRATDKFAAFDNSFVIATGVTGAFLRSVDTTNGGKPFGFFAAAGVGRVTVGYPKIWGYTPADGNLKLLDDFAVVIV